MVKAERVDTGTRDLTVARTAITQNKGRFSNIDLPQGSETRFRYMVIPTLYQMVSTIENGWEIPDTLFIKMLQAIWRVAFADQGALANHIIALRGPAFKVVCASPLQRLSDG